MPMLVATASIAWIFAVTAAAATAEALGRGEYSHVTKGEVRR